MERQRLLALCRVIALIAVLFVAFHQGHSHAADFTAVEMDGLTWREFVKAFEKAKDEELAHVIKLAVVRGIYEGIFRGDSSDKASFYTKTSYDHLVRALDQFYSDYRNEKIWVVAALRVIAMELRGEPKDAIEKETQRLRALFGAKK